MREFLTEEEYLVHLLRCALRQEQPEELPEGRRALPGSVAFVPSVAGLIIAGEVIKDLIK